MKILIKFIIITEIAFICRSVHAVRISFASKVARKLHTYTCYQRLYGICAQRTPLCIYRRSTAENQFNSSLNQAVAGVTLLSKRFGNQYLLQCVGSGGKYVIFTLLKFYISLEQPGTVSPLNMDCRFWWRWTKIPLNCFFAFVLHRETCQRHRNVRKVLNGDLIVL